MTDQSNDVDVRKCVLRMQYAILDLPSGPVLQETELIKVKGNWHYYRCPATGLEWHKNGATYYLVDSESEAWFRHVWTCYFYFSALISQSWNLDDFNKWSSNILAGFAKLKSAIEHYRNSCSDDRVCP